ncbi:MAG: alpha-ketoacid dehydrogenase subunit beta [Candidatus Aenigmarchaeota archaeon]|nr:alpha-ketoacid dehydrogenase subunit beta [Candidatus Aenigmarchaeota archaeon]
MPNLTIVQAVNYALMQEMARDANVIVLGEDVARNGGVFRATEGLWEKFGDGRVIDTPLAESGIVGVSIGLAAYGFRPVAEIQFDGFTYPAFDQLISHATRIRTRSRGRFSCPLVVRAPYGGGIHAPEHHSEAPEAFYTHMPGVKVVIPSTPYDTKGLLVSAIRDPDPVIFFEPKKIYRAFKQEVPEEDYAIPLGKASVAREGVDVSIFTWGSMVRTCLEAAEKIKDRVSVEVVDMRTLSPLDTDAINASVKKTGRVVIVHEAPKSSGVGAEIAALIDRKDLLYLEAPVVRVTGFDTVFPLAKLEKYYMPDASRITKGIEKVMDF